MYCMTSLLLMAVLSCNYFCSSFIKNSNLLLLPVRHRLVPISHHYDRYCNSNYFSHHSPKSYSTTRSNVAVYNDASIIDKNYALECGGAMPLTPSSAVKLPELSANELKLLNSGETIQGQKRDGSAGIGWVVLDVEACPHLVFSSLLDFDSYASMIPTVRSVKVYERDRNTERYKVEYCLSKFRLKTNVVHEVNQDEKLIRFSLDDNRPNLVFRQADGFWLIQSDPSNASRCRVWLYASIVCSRVVPTLIVDYAACRALPRATNWIRPHFSQLQMLQRASRGGNGSSLLG